MPRYVIGNVEVPVNPVTATTVVAPAGLAEKEALKKAKEIAAGDGKIVGPPPSDGTSNVLVYGGIAAAVAGYWWWSTKRKKPAASGA